MLTRNVPLFSCATRTVRVRASQGRLERVLPRMTASVDRALLMAPVLPVSLAAVTSSLPAVDGQRVRKSVVYFPIVNNFTLSTANSTYFVNGLYPKLDNGTK